MNVKWAPPAHGAMVGQNLTGNGSENLTRPTAGAVMGSSSRFGQNLTRTGSGGGYIPLFTHARVPASRAAGRRGRRGRAVPASDGRGTSSGLASRAAVPGPR